MQINWKKNTALFMTGQALSLFGTMIVQYAILWHIVLQTKSGGMMTIVTLVAFIPMLLISPFAGVWADRYNRKILINIADGTVAFFSLIVAVCLLLGIDSLAILFICSFVRALGQGVQTPAVMSFLPDIVPQERLIKINGFQASIQSVINIASPMVGAALMTFAPLYALFLLDVITAAIGISIVFFFVKVPKRENARTQTQTPEQTQENANENAPAAASYFREIKEGFKYCKNHGFVLRMIIFTAVYMFMVAPVSFLTPLQVARNFGADVWRLSVIEITFAVGMILGGVLIGVWGGFKNRIYTMTSSCVLGGLLAAALGIVPFFWVYAGIMALIGITLPFFNAPNATLLQTLVEPAFMGRVMALFNMVCSAVLPAGMLVFGPLADVISIDYILIASGICMALASIPLLFSRTLVAAGRGDVPIENGEGK